MLGSERTGIPRSAWSHATTDTSARSVAKGTRAATDEPAEAALPSRRLGPTTSPNESTNEKGPGFSGVGSRPSR